MVREELYKEKVKEGLTPLERLSLLVPGFRGYKEKELRRGTDQLIRDAAFTRIVQGARDLKWCYREIVNASRTREAQQVDRLVMKVDRTAQKIKHAERGYSSRWEAAKIYENELDNLIAFDARLVATSEDFRSKVAAVKEDLGKGNVESGTGTIPDLERFIDEFDETLAKRREVMLAIEGRVGP